ncbi:MAG: glycosyltransferase [Terrisporobacter sp.]|uniref:glycosyltransferase family 2 protein n=1 Tax=Terrisporobacter sp. TaxID=1965305 RepID=UPI002F926C20
MEIKNPLISIIVPVYNVEKYLARCIDSILNQSLKNIEIILVDDGSTDSSPSICDEYSSKYENITAIHKKNERVSAARNDGIKLAKGKYIGFVDSDDWIEFNMFESMYKVAEDTKSDIVMCDFKKVGIQNQYKVSQPIREGYYDRNMIEKELFPCIIMFENIEFPPTISNWTILFRRKFLVDNNIYYDEDIHYCEDSIFGSKAMYNANSFYYMKGSYFYNYFYNPSSTTTTFNMKKWDSYVTINNRLKEYFKNDEFDFSRQIKINMLYFTLNFLKEIKGTNLSDKEKEIECKKILNDKAVKNIFKKFSMPDVHFKLKVIIMIIKYRLSFVYSRL